MMRGDDELGEAAAFLAVQDLIRVHLVNTALTL
jgi:hypothetical protein